MEYEYIRIPKADDSLITAADLSQELYSWLTKYNTVDQKIPQILFGLVYGDKIKRIKSPSFKQYLDSISIVAANNYACQRGISLTELLSIINQGTSPALMTPVQRIYYGAPGTGKSHKAKEVTYGKKVFRTTFHPDTDYASFVGCYKPCINNQSVVRDSNGKVVAGEFDKKIEYSYTPQIFVKAYCEAWKLYLDYYKSTASIATSTATSASQNPNIKQSSTSTAAGKPVCENVCLLIEELNRGNCAQIFGDLFQLLDRTPNGFSEYSILADSDLSKYIKEDSELKNTLKEYYEIIQENSDITDEGLPLIPNWDSANPDKNEVRICLPPNLSIICTMNTSDQSLFPMDSAFKRRWEWEYVPIDYDSTKSEFVIVVDDEHQYNWLEFLYSINTVISEVTNSEDKQLGNFFVKGDENNEVSSDLFVSKVMHFLWNDVCKDNPKARKKIFTTTINGNSKEFSFNQIFSKDRNNYIIGFMESLKVPTVISEPDNTGVLEPDTITKKFTKYSVNGDGAFSRQSVAWEAVKLYAKNNNLNPANTSDVDKLFSEWDSFNVKKMTSAYPLISKTKNSRSKKIPDFEIYVNNRDWFVDNFTKFMNDVNNKPSLGIKIATV